MLKRINVIFSALVAVALFGCNKDPEVAVPAEAPPADTSQAASTAVSPNTTAVDAETAKVATAATAAAVQPVAANSVPSVVTAATTKNVSQSVAHDKGKKHKKIKKAGRQHKIAAAHNKKSHRHQKTTASKKPKKRAVS